MFISHTFIIDLRSEDASVMAENLSDSMWEYAMFIACCSEKEKFFLSWNIFVIDENGNLFHPYCQSNDFSFVHLFDVLGNLKSHVFSNQIPSDQNPLCCSIDLCLNGPAEQNLCFVFMSSRNENILNPGEYAALKETFHKRMVSYPNSSSPSFVMIGPKTLSCDALSEISKTIVFDNEDDFFFQFFRSLVSDLLYSPIFEILKVGELQIGCLNHFLLSGSSSFREKPICMCHNAALCSKEANLVCSISGKKIGKQNVKNSFFLGEYQVPFLPNSETDGDEEPVLVLNAIAKIDTKNISETYLFGEETIITSESPKFRRILNEMRFSNQSIIARRNQTKTFGGEYFLLAADMLRMIIHCKRIANRSQIIEFPESKANQTEQFEIYNEPILPSLKEVYEFTPFILGRSSIIPNH